MGPPTSSAPYRYDQTKNPSSSYGGRIPVAGPAAPAVLEPTPHDVLIVRGQRGLNTPGNVLFRHLIKARAVDYQATDRSHVRDSIASAIMAEIAEHGGRFLQLPIIIPNVEDAAGGGGPASFSWVVIRKNVARAKIKQALRDTIKSSAAAAHQHRYSKQPQQQRHRQLAATAASTTSHQSPIIRDTFDSNPAPSSSSSFLLETTTWQSPSCGPPNNHDNHNLALRNGSRSSTAPGDHVLPLASPTVLARGSSSSSCATTGVLPSVEQAAAKAMVQAVGRTNNVPAAAAAASSSYHNNKARMVAEMLFSPRNRETTTRSSHDGLQQAQPPQLQPMMIPHELVLADHQSLVASSCRLPAAAVCFPPASDPIWNNDPPPPPQWPAVIPPSPSLIVRPRQQQRQQQ
jgi:hypothetical protein